jgi:hypothetical protein
MATPDTKLATSILDGAHRLGVGLSTMKLLLARNDVKSVRIGRRRLVLVQSLSDYLSRLTSQ